MDQERKTKKKKPSPIVILSDTWFNTTFLQRGPFERRGQTKKQKGQKDRDLLELDPFEIRNGVFSHSEEEYWGMIENLLGALEWEAESVFKGKETPQLEDRRGLSVTEDNFWNLFGLGKLPSDQANAIAVLRSVQQIRKEFRLRKVQGHYILDGIERGIDQMYDSRTVAQLMLEMALLITATFRGDFWGKYWDHIEWSVGRRAHLREASQLGTKKVKERAAVLRKTCAEIAALAPKGLTQGGRAKFVQGRLPKKLWISLRRIKDLIQ